MKLTSSARFSTICIHAGQEPDPTTGAIITPIYQTSTYVQPELGRHKGFEYARTQNPTRSALEGNLAAIEGGTRSVCVRVRHGRHLRDHQPAVVRRPRHRDREHVWRHVPAVRPGAAALPDRVQLRRHRRPRRRGARHPARDPVALRRDAHQPRDDDSRTLRRAADLAHASRRPSGGGQHVRQSVPAASASSSERTSSSTARRST